MPDQLMDARRPLLALVAALFLAACAASAASPSAEPTEVAPEVVTLKLVRQPFLGAAPIAVAYEEGYFREQGIEIEFIELEQGADALPLLVQGSVDVLSSTPNAGLFNLMAQGEPLAIVADRSHVTSEAECGTPTVMVRQELLDSGEVVEPADLSGLTVSAELGEFNEYVVDELLAQGGLTHDDVTWTEVPFPALTEAFGQGNLDFAVIGEPWITRIADSGTAADWIRVDAITPNLPISFVVFGPSLLIEQPEVGERFMVAYLKGVRQINEGKTERNIELIAANIGLEPELVEVACWYAVRSDGSISPESVINFQEWAVSKDYQDEVVPAETFWNSHFVDYANSVLGAATE